MIGSPALCLGSKEGKGSLGNFVRVCLKIKSKKGGFMYHRGGVLASHMEGSE